MPRYLLPDRDAIFGQDFREQVRDVGICVRNLGTLGGAQGSSAHSINDQSWIAGVANLTGDTAEHAAFWQNGVVTDLGTLGGDNTSFSTECASGAFEVVP